FDLDFDHAGGQLGVLLSGQAARDLALDGNDIFAAQLLGGGKESLATFWLEYNLGDAVAVTQVDEEKNAMIAVGVDPTVQDHGLSNVGLAQFTTRMRPPQERHEIFPLSLWVDEPGTVSLDYRE